MRRSPALLSSSTKDRKCGCLNQNRFGLTPAVSLPRIAPALSWFMFSWSQTGQVLMSLSRMLIPGRGRQFRRAVASQRCVSFPSSLVSLAGLKHSKGVSHKQKYKWKTSGSKDCKCKHTGTHRGTYTPGKFLEGYQTTDAWLWQRQTGCTGLDRHISPVLRTIASC